MTRRRAWALALSGLVVVALLAAGTRYEADVYRCQSTGALRKVERRVYGFVPTSAKVSIEAGGVAPPGGIHQWRHYTSYRQYGPGGIFGKRIEVDDFTNLPAIPPERVAGG